MIDDERALNEQEDKRVSNEIFRFSSLSVLKETMTVTQTHDECDILVKSTDSAMSPTGMIRRTFFDRTFSKMEKGSVRGGIFNMISAALGGGVLSIPFVFVLSGWATGIILLIIGYFASYWSNLMIAKIATNHSGVRNLD